MATPASGTISLNQVHVEAGGSSGSQCSFNDSDIRSICASGLGTSLSMSNMYARAADFQASATVGYGSTHYQLAYANYTTNYKGYVAGITSPANLSPTSDSDYMGGGTIGNVSISSISTNFPLHTFIISCGGASSSNVPNDDNNVFNSVVVGSTTFDRGAFSFSTGSSTITLSQVATNPGVYVGSGSNNPPFPNSGTYYVTFRRRV